MLVVCLLWLAVFVMYMCVFMFCLQCVFVLFGVVVVLVFVFALFPELSACCLMVGCVVCVCCVRHPPIMCCCFCLLHAPPQLCLPFVFSCAAFA